MVWFIQCISVNGVVVDLVWVTKNLSSNTELIKTTDYIEDLHATIFAGPRLSFRLDRKEMQQTFELHFYYLANAPMEQDITQQSYYLTWW